VGRRRENQVWKEYTHADLPKVMKIIDKELSEPYSIFTYRYFLHQWPQLCFLVRPAASPGAACDTRSPYAQPTRSIAFRHAFSSVDLRSVLPLSLEPEPSAPLREVPRQPPQSSWTFGSSGYRLDLWCPQQGTALLRR